MARKTTAARKKSGTVSHLFQIQLSEATLTRAQVQRVAKAIRTVAAKELLKMDFRIEEVNRPLFDPQSGAGCQGCGSGCNA